MAREIEGPLHSVKVRIVTQKYLTKHFGDKGESVLGCYVAEDNKVYIAKELEPVIQAHTLLHELYHVFVEHTKDHDEEHAADAFATLLMRIFKPESIDVLLNNRD